ncbi:MAG: hypothetical protein DME05_15715 [Candidatus Rokuibacteriota bacterium]|nr:MAG: hypothetical protein DME05_15715 [Candidatus Rokubacteria bacterium]
MAQPRSRTLPDLLDEITARDPAREFIVAGPERLSYGETRGRARQLAKGLRRLGVKRGDKVALLMSNRPEWLLVDFAVTMLGATLVPISTWSRARELAYVLDHCDATTLITLDPGPPSSAVQGRSTSPRSAASSPSDASWARSGTWARPSTTPSSTPRSAPSLPTTWPASSTRPARRRRPRASSSSIAGSSRTCGTSASAST